MSEISEIFNESLEFISLYSILLVVLLFVVNKKTGKFHYKITSLILFLIASFRVNVGSDYYNYYVKFAGIDSAYLGYFDILERSSDIGYDMLNYFLKTITDYRFAIFFLVSFLIYPETMKFIKKHSINPRDSLFIYFCFGFFLMSLNILKHSIALTFLFLMYTSLKEKNKLKSLMYLFFAFLMHSTSLVIGLIIIISRKLKPSYSLLIYSIVIGLINLFFLKNIYYFIAKIFPIFNKYSNYFEDILFVDRSISFMILIMIVFVTFIACLCLKNQKLIREISNDRYYDISLIIIGICFSITSYVFWPFNRFALYLYSFLILLMPVLFTVVSNKKRLFLKGCSLIYCIAFILFYDENLYRQYDTFLFDDNKIVLPVAVFNYGK